MSGAGAARRHQPRTGQQVHRYSYHEGERETRPWLQHNTFADSEHNARMRALEEFERSTRRRGRRNGALGHIALEVYRFLLRLRNRKTGRLDPSYDWIAKQLNRSRSAVARAIRRLKDANFLDWQRRTRPVEDPEPDGQYVEQISNAYFLTLREGAAELVRRVLRRPTEKMRRIAEEKRRAAERRADEAKPDEQLLSGIVDPYLRKALERLSAKLEGASPPGPINSALKIKE